MSTGPTFPSRIHFGVFDLDLGAGELRRSGTRIKLAPQPFKLLALIAARPGQLVTREEVQQEIWGTETFVDFEQGMNHCMKQIRNALGDNAEAPRYVETVPRRGYRFIAAVEPEAALRPEKPAESTPPAVTPKPRDRLALVLVVVAIVSLLVVGVTFRVIRERRSAAPHGIQSIAVLPFADLSRDSSQEYFSDGLAEQLIDSLANLPGLRVVARTSSFQFKRKHEDVGSIGRKLNVSALVEGSVRTQGNRARITVQLINVADGFHLWSETFDRDMTDIFAVQEEISRAVASRLSVRLPDDRKYKARRTGPEAYRAYLQGRYLVRQASKEILERAAIHFEQATRLDPGFAPGWVALGEVLTSQAGSAYVGVEEGYAKARDAVNRALTLDADLGEAHAAMGELQMIRDWDWAGANASYRRAMELEPGNAGVVRGAGSLARFLGRLDEAVALYRRAVELDPLQANGHKNLGMCLYYAGRYAEAMAEIGKALEIAPEMAVGHNLLAQIHLALSHPEEALAEAGKENHIILRLSALAMAYRALGRDSQSSANLRELTSRFQADAPYQIAQVHAFRREADQAFIWLERSFASRDPGLSEMKADPILQYLRKDSRYPALLAKMKLPA